MSHVCPDLAAARDCRDAVATIEPEQKLPAALLEARERLARRGVFWGTWMVSDDMKVSKGLEFPVVALPSVVHMPAKGEDEQEAARVF